MKPTLNLKDQYILMVFLFFCTGLLTVHSQIIYTDIIPDYESQVASDFYNLDLNNDGVIDFTIFSDPNFLWIRSEISGNAFIGLAPWYTNIRPLNNNDFIGPIPVYNGLADWWPSLGGGVFSTGCPTFESNCDWGWTNTSNKFLGLRFKIGTQTHYGWARMDVTDEFHWVIKDYAYYGIAGESIHAGQTTLGIDDNNVTNNIKIITANNSIKIYNLTETIKFKLFSITGNMVVKGSLSMDNNIINTNSFPKGIYVLELDNSNSGNTIKKKVIL